MSVGMMNRDVSWVVAVLVLTRSVMEEWTAWTALMSGIA